MEDRLNAGLVLLLLDEAQARLRSALEESLGGQPGTGQISWWQNLCPDRTDWLGDLRRLDEFAMLGICECDGDVAAVAVPHGVRTLRMRRYPRPSQGVLRLPTLGLALVLISPKNLDDDAAAQSLRDWGDFVHFPGIVDANIPGYALVTPYENIARDAPRFLHLYEFPDPEAEAVFQRTRPSVTQRFGAGPGSPAFEHWAVHPELVIDYVNCFARLDADGKVMRSQDAAIPA